MEPTTPLGQDLGRGWSGKCPACGKGRLFGKYLKVERACGECGEEFFHHRADDFPAYIVILVLGHVLVPLVIEVEMSFSPPMWVHALLWLPLACLTTYLMLPRVKGAIVAYQWRKGMHGFRKARDARVKATPSA